MENKMKHPIYSKMVDDLFEKNPQPTKYDLYCWLIDNEWRVSQSYETDCHKQDILDEIERRNQMYRDDCAEQGILPNYDKLIKVDDEKLDDMLYRYEDHLADSEDWHFIMNSVIDDFCGDYGDMGE